MNGPVPDERSRSSVRRHRISPPNVGNSILICPGETAGMRDRLMHHHYGVDYETVDVTVIHDIPELRKGIEGILDLPEGSGDT